MQRRVPGGCAVALALLLSLSSAAEAQRVEWRGFVQQSFSPACAPFRGSRAQATMRLLPSGIGSNGADTSMSFIHPGHATDFRRVGGRFGLRFSAVRTTAVGANGNTYTNGLLRVASMTPRNGALSIETPQIRMEGQVRNSDGIPGCETTFEATLLRRW